MGTCCAVNLPKNPKVNQDQVPDGKRQSMLRYQTVLVWKKKIYEQIDKNPAFAKLWQSKKIAQYKHLVTTVVNQALEQIKLKDKEWTESELYQKLMIKQNTLQSQEFCNLMAEQKAKEQAKKDKQKTSEVTNTIVGNTKQKVTDSALQTDKQAKKQMGKNYAEQTQT